jgi:spermidine synthase
MPAVFVALAFLSGAVALSHELLWTRRLIDLLGATESVTGRVLGLFFLGLALGGWLATRWSRATEGNSAVRLGMAEISIAFLSLPAIFLPFWADSLISTLGTDVLVSWHGQLIKALVTAAVVLPPAIAMGTTMPMFIRVMTDLGGTLSDGGIWVYSWNMLGGVFGLWLVSTVLLEASGVQGAMLCAAAGNVVIGLASFVLSSRVRTFQEVESPDGATENKEPMSVPGERRSSLASSKSSFQSVLTLAFASGLIVLASEVLILRMLALIAPSSIQTTSALLANVILFLALGSIFVALMNRLGVSCHTQLMIGVIGASLFCLLCPLILYQATNQLVSVRYLAALEGKNIVSIGHYWILLFMLVAWSSGAAMFFFGFVFPSIMSIHSSHDPAGRSVGLLLAINGLGGLLGAELANLLLVFQVGIFRGFVVLAIASALVAVAICIQSRQKLTAVGVVLAGVLVGLLSLDSYEELRYLSPRTKKKFTIEDTRFGREGVLLVVKGAKGARSLLMNNQYILGSSETRATAAERRQLWIPWLLHPKSEKVCCLAFATGISATALEFLNNPPEVTSVELSQKVTEVAREYYRDQHTSFFQRAGNRVVHEDARTFMACANAEYDLIVADLFRPHGAGESRLFSVEHFRNVKKALRADGLFCQWLPAHQLNQKQFETIARTFMEVFSNVLVVNAGTKSNAPTVGLCAWQDDKEWQTEALAKKVVDFRNEKRISDVLALNAQLLIVGVLKEDAFSSAPVNTLDNALLEIDAGEFWITKDLRPRRQADTLENGFLSGPNWKRFSRQLLERTAPVLDPVHREHYIQSIK